MAKKETQCDNCETEFTYYPSSKKGRFCSECVEEADMAAGPDKIEPDWEEINRDSQISGEEYYDNSSERTGLKDSNVGDVSEKVFETEMVKRGINISKSLTYMCEYDYVVEIGNEFYRAQVKTGTQNNGSIDFQTCRRHENRRKSVKKQYENVDAFVVRNKRDDKLYWIPFEDTSKTQMSIRVKEPIQYQQNINWADQY